MEVLFFWFILAILVGVYASSKGRSSVGFFFLAVLLSPLLGFLIALVASPDLNEVEAKKVATGQSKKCPHCAEIIKAEAKVCRYCGNTV